MAIDIFDTQASVAGTGIVKHGTIIVNPGHGPTTSPSDPGGNFGKGNTDVFNNPLIVEISGKYDTKFDDPTYYG